MSTPVRAVIDAGRDLTVSETVQAISFEQDFEAVVRRNCFVQPLRQVRVTCEAHTCYLDRAWPDHDLWVDEPSTSLRRWPAIFHASGDYLGQVCVPDPQITPKNEFSAAGGGPVPRFAG